MPAFQNRLVADIASFSKGMKKAGRTFEKRGKRVGASQRIKRAPNNHLSNAGKQMK